jgi:hypothetical protein
MAYQAITTKYVGPTNHRGTRVIATSEGGHRLVHSWKYELGTYENHKAAAQALAHKLGWKGTLHGGSTRKGYAFVFDESGRDARRARGRSRLSRVHSRRRAKRR